MLEEGCINCTIAAVAVALSAAVADDRIASGAAVAGGSSEAASGSQTVRAAVASTGDVTRTTDSSLHLQNVG